MDGRTHSESALQWNIALVFLLSVYLLNYKFVVFGVDFYPILWIPLSFHGGLFPDIDAKGTTISNMYRRVYVITYSVIGLCMGVVYYIFRDLSILSTTIIIVTSTLAYFVWVDVSRYKFYHRGETHSYFFCLLPSVIAFVLSKLLGNYILFNLIFGFSLGAINHMWADTFNVKPLKEYLYPILPLRGGKRSKYSAQRKKRYNRKKFNKMFRIPSEDTAQIKLFRRYNRLGCYFVSIAGFGLILYFRYF